MKIRQYTTHLMIMVVLVFGAGPGLAADLSDFTKDARKALGGSSVGLSSDDITAGLKEALQVGTEKAVGLVSQPDGFYQNPAIKIPLPESVQKVEKWLRTAGYGEKVDAFELSMNRAAERAAPEAKSIFWDAIADMNFDDAQKILNGRDNEATLYFEEKTSARLQEVFKPIVKDAMGEVGVTRSYQELSDKIASLPFGRSTGFDVDQYVTDGALKAV